MPSVAASAPSISKDNVQAAPMQLGSLQASKPRLTFSLDHNDKDKNLSIGLQQVTPKGEPGSTAQAASIALADAIDTAVLATRSDSATNSLFRRLIMEDVEPMRCAKYSHMQRPLSVCYQWQDCSTGLTCFHVHVPHMHVPPQQPCSPTYQVLYLTFKTRETARTQGTSLNGSRQGWDWVSPEENSFRWSPL